MAPSAGCRTWKKWAQVVAHFMKPGGSFVFAEFHPVVWMFDNDLKYVQYSYFKAEPIPKRSQVRMQIVKLIPNIQP